MVATSTGGSITGKGGNRFIIDDPHNPIQAESDAQRQQAIDVFRYVLDRFKARASFTETCQAITQMVAKYPNARAVLVEDAANGPAVVSVLQKEIRAILAVTPEGGKQSRAAAVQPQIEAGQVLLPRPRFADGQLRFEFLWRVAWGPYRVAGFAGLPGCTTCSSRNSSKASKSRSEWSSA